MGGRQVANVFAEEEEISKTESPRQGQIKTRVKDLHGLQKTRRSVSNSKPAFNRIVTTALYLPSLHCPTDFDRQCVKATTTQSVIPLEYTLARDSL